MSLPTTTCPDCQAPLIGHCDGPKVTGPKCMWARCPRCKSFGYPKGARWYSTTQQRAVGWLAEENTGRKDVIE